MIELNSEDLFSVLLVQKAIETVKALHWFVVVVVVVNGLAFGFSSSTF